MLILCCILLLLFERWWRYCDKLESGNYLLNSVFFSFCFSQKNEACVALSVEQQVSGCRAVGLVLQSHSILQWFKRGSLSQNIYKCTGTFVYSSIPLSGHPAAFVWLAEGGDRCQFLSDFLLPTSDLRLFSTCTYLLCPCYKQHPSSLRGVNLVQYHLINRLFLNTEYVNDTLVGFHTLFLLVIFIPLNSFNECFLTGRGLNDGTSL